VYTDIKDFGMEITTKQLRIQPGKILSQVSNGQDVTITYRGKPWAKLVPIAERRPVYLDDSEDELFGIWEDRDEMKNVEQYVKNMRKSRKLLSSEKA
jgi:prevent-host-death family protein